MYSFSHTRRIRRRAVLLAACLGAALLVLPAAAQATPQVLLGAYTKNTYSGQNAWQAYRTLESQLGRKLAIDHVGFIGFSSPFPLTRMRWDVQGGRAPFVSWHQVASTKLSSGSEDATLRRVADELRGLGGHVFLQFAAEMDRKAVAGTPQQFIAAWRHVYNVFHAQGAGNVSFVWCPTAYGFTTGRAQPYYPGGAYADWVCADGYNWGSVHPTSTWSWFGQIFRSFYSWAAPHGKPIIIGEWASVEGSPGQKATWLQDARSRVKSSFPLIHGLVYFDSNGWDETTNQAVDWRANSSSSAFSAFKALALDPYYTRRS